MTHRILTDLTVTFFGLHTPILDFDNYNLISIEIDSVNKNQKCLYRLTPVAYEITIRDIVKKNKKNCLSDLVYNFRRKERDIQYEIDNAHVYAAIKAERIATQKRRCESRIISRLNYHKKYFRHTPNESVQRFREFKEWRRNCFFKDHIIISVHTLFE
jgi:hypothetical protein